MAAIVKANPSLTAGGLSVLRRSYSTTDDGTLNYEVEYCCLSQFANNHIGKFRTRSTPPTAIPASMSALPLRSLPALYDFSTSTENGLTYFRAKYATASISRDQNETIITESSEQRSFSATVPGVIRGNFTGFGTGTKESFVTLSFDYISTTVKAEGKSRSEIPAVHGSVSQPFNFSQGQIDGQNAQTTGAFRATTIESRSSSRSSLGTYTFSLSSTGIYQTNVRQTAV